MRPGRFENGVEYRRRGPADGDPSRTTSVRARRDVQRFITSRRRKVLPKLFGVPLPVPPMRAISPVTLGAALALCASSAFAQAARPPLDSATLAGLRWRTVGPGNFEGRVADLAVIPRPSNTISVAAAAGGIWTTTNGVVTLRPVSDHYPPAALAAAALP